MRSGDLELADLIDVELQLLRDRDLAPEELRRRDRRIGVSLDADRRVRAGERRLVLAGWVREVRRESDGESAGERTVRAYHALGWLLGLVGALFGMGTAAAVLAYDGSRPVNVVHFLAVFVGAQLALLLLLLLSTLVWSMRERLPGFSGVYGLLRLLLDAVVRAFERRLTAERRSSLAAARGRLRASTVVYGELERWLLISLGQRFGLWFNLGALATCLYLVAFSDLAFAWQTTLEWSAESFHRTVALIAAPWSWLYPDGLPSLDVVRSTRYFRLDGSFARPESALLYGQWWRFLVASLLCYGVLPRVVLSILARLRLRRALRRIELDHGEVASLLERLASPLVSTRAPVAEAAPADAPAATAPVAVEEPRGEATQVIVWGDVPGDPAPLVARRFGAPVAARHAAGTDETGQDDAAIAAVAATRGGVVIVAEAFESPTREAKAFVGRLRAAIGPRRPVAVALVDAGAAPPAADDLAIWRKHMAGLGDPYLRVEALTGEEEP